MLILAFLLACWWPSSAPAPSQPYLMETISYGDSDSSPQAGDPRSEAVDPEPQAAPEAGGAVPRADPGVGGDDA